MLIHSLETVRKQLEDGADDWRYSLLTVFREYLRALGVERRLIDPVEKFRLETGDRIRHARGGQEEAPRNTSPGIAMAYAAAAVTALRQWHDWKLPDAIASVARTSGIDKGDLKNFRDNLSRGARHGPAGAHEAYDKVLDDMRDRQYSPDMILGAVAGLGVYLEKGGLISKKEGSVLEIGPL